jgi:hypothetical protein
LNAEFDGGKISVVVNAERFSICLFPQAKSAGTGFRIASPAYLQIRTEIPLQHESFRIRKSDTLDWISEQIFRVQDHQTGDVVFDREFHVSVDNEAWGERTFSNEIVRKNIHEIFCNGFSRICAATNILTAEVLVKSSADLPSSDRTRKTMICMSNIIKELPSKWFSGFKPK